MKNKGFIVKAFTTKEIYVSLEHSTHKHILAGNQNFFKKKLNIYLDAS